MRSSSSFNSQLLIEAKVASSQLFAEVEFWMLKLRILNHEWTIETVLQRGERGVSGQMCIWQPPSFMLFLVWSLACASLTYIRPQVHVLGFSRPSDQLCCRLEQVQCACVE